MPLHRFTAARGGKMFVKFDQYRTKLCHCLAQGDSIAGLAIRLYLAPIFWMAGSQKLAHFSETVAWFGNADWGLGLPFPALLAALATATELLGAVLLALGLFTRLIALPLIVTMLVAIFAVHWEYGWQAIADASAPFANERVLAASEKLARATDLLQTHGHYQWLTSSGKFVILNNGIEFATTYLIMLLALLAWGPGRYFSLDYYLVRWLKGRATVTDATASTEK